jgi:hypothetical protein
MANRFAVLIGGVLHTYEQYELIPDQFDQVIKFLPDSPANLGFRVPLRPLTDKQYDEIKLWVLRFERLMEIEYASSSQKR